MIIHNSYAKSKPCSFSNIHLRVRDDFVSVPTLLTVGQSEIATNYQHIIENPEKTAKQLRNDWLCADVDITNIKRTSPTSLVVACKSEAALNARVHIQKLYALTHPAQTAWGTIPPTKRSIKLSITSGMLYENPNDDCYSGIHFPVANCHIQ